MSQSLLVRGGTVVDGTRAPSREADVRVVDGRIAEIGPGLAPGDAEVVDATGLVVAPGFIDPHTHYDAQIFWDPDLSPSSWHGVTTVVTGNTGFTLAPNVPEVRGLLVDMLTMVEGMPKESLVAGVDWSFESFGEYLDALDALPSRVNMATMVGHSTVRYAVMGEEAMERHATDEEIDTMRRLVAESLDAGAIGFTSSRSTSHIGARNKPVPSRVGKVEEIWALAAALREASKGIIEVTWGPDLFVEEVAKLAQDTGRTVTWAAVLTQRAQPDWTRDILARTEAVGGDVRPQIAAKPLVTQIDLARQGTMAIVPAFAAAIAQPLDERLRRFADKEWRELAAKDIATSGDWQDRLPRTRVQDSNGHPELVGTTLGELAADRGVTPMDVMLDLVLEDTLGTRFSVVVMNDDIDEVAGLLANDRLVLGLSDGGAHTAQICDADAPTYLLANWWRARQSISLEDAVWRLSGQPAEVFGLVDRGRIAEGFMGDLVAFDPATVAPGSHERRADLPGGVERLVVPSTGIEHVWVRGEQVRRHGQPVVGAYPGAVLRGGRG